MSKTGLDKLLVDENKIVIVFLIYVFGSLNLKIISKLLEKTEPPILRWLKKMEEEGLIEIDQKVTQLSRGKYYKLTKETEEFFDFEQFPANTDEVDIDAKKKINLQGTNLIRSLGIISEITMKITANFMKDFTFNNELKESIKKGGYTAFSSFSMIHFKNPEEIAHFNDIFNEFADKIEEEFDTEGVREPKKYSHCMNFSVLPIAKIKEKIDDMKIEW